MNILLAIILAILLYYAIMTGFSTSPARTVIPTPASPQVSGNNITDLIGTTLSNVNTGINSLVTDIINTANANGLNPAILYGIVSAEQGTTNPNEWNSGAYNPSDPSGAYGLTQVLGTTAESLGVSPQLLLQSPTTALDTTAKYILKYTPTNTNNISIVAGVYNGGADIFNEIQNGTVNTNVINAVGAYIEKASNGYNYFNQTYTNTQ